MSSIQKVFDNQDIMREIFSYYPKRCRSCHNVMERKFLDHNDPKVYNFYNLTWRKTENKFCRGYCNWCCKYVFNHPY
jgi:hypothetical protein